MLPRRSAIPLAAVAAGILLAGCKSAYHEDAVGFSSAITSGDMKQAVALAQEKLAASDEESRVVWTLDLAYAQRMAGDIQGSIATFEQADELLSAIDEQPEISLSREALSIFSNPYKLTYRGRNLDRIFASTYQALACIEAGQIEQARVPMNRTMFRIDDAKRIASARIAAGNKEAAEIASEDQEFQKRLTSGEVQEANAELQSELRGLPTYANALNPFAAWLHGVYFLHTAQDGSELELARKSLQAAAATITDAPCVKEDLALATNGTGRPEPGENKTIVYVVYEAGMAPRWSEKIITFPLILGDRRAPVVRVALPQVKASNSRPAPLIAQTNGSPIRLSLLANVNAIVLDEFKDEYPVVRNRAIASATFKATAAYLANKAAEDRSRRKPGDRGAQEGEIAVKLLTNLYNVNSAQADLRNWSSLPGWIYVGRATATRGSVLRLTGPGVPGIYDCRLPKARAVIVTIRSIGSNVPSIVRAGILQP